MTRRVSIILVLAILVLALSVALPGCGGEKTDGDIEDGSTSTGKPEILLFTQEG